MYRLIFTSFIFTISLTAQATDPVTLLDQADKINYTIGYQIGKDFKRSKISLNKMAVKQGLVDGHYDMPPLIDKQEMNTALSELYKKSLTKAQKEAMARIENRRKMQNKNQ